MPDSPDSTTRTTAAPRCPVCGRTAVLNKDLSIRKHMRQEPGRWRMVPCAGSGTNAV